MYFSLHRVYSVFRIKLGESSGKNVILSADLSVKIAYQLQKPA